MHIFDHTVKLVLLYGSEIWGALNPSSPRLRNDISLDKVYQNIDPDKFNTKFCKLRLGLTKKSSNFAVYAEMGRHPFYFDIVKSKLLFGIGLKICLLTLYYINVKNISMKLEISIISEVLQG